MSGPKPPAEPRADEVLDLPEWLAGRLLAAPAEPCTGWLVAFSGGPDSLALLAALQQLRLSRSARARPPLRAVHIDHGLNPRSGAWARACRVACARLGVPLTVRRARLVLGPGVSVEAAAREARYARLRESLHRGEWLFTAHHLDDQLETILLQLMRGAGVSGLAGMPESVGFGRGLHRRPLLVLERGQLLRWLEARGLEWIDDESNADPRFDRNYLRHQVLPLLRARWPAAARVAARSAAHLAEARTLLADLAAQDLRRVRRGRSLDATGLAALSAPRQRNLVRAWIAAEGLPVPDSRHLARIVGELRLARPDAAPVVAWPGAQVRRHRGRMFAMAAAGPATAAATRDAVHRWRWAGSHPLELGPGLGALVMRRDPAGTLRSAALPSTLLVRFRAGGERLRTEATGPRRALKELLRARGVLPWMRARLPLLYAGDALVAVANLFVAAEFRAGDRDRARYRLDWSGPPTTAEDDDCDEVRVSRTASARGRGAI